MQVMAAEFSRYPGEFRCSFGEKSFKKFVSIYLIENGLLN
jgi:hypothetical protein